MTAESVRAILEGRKTQTRRVVRFPDDHFFKGVTGQIQQHYEFKSAYPMPKCGFVFWSGDPGKEFSDLAYQDSNDGFYCPYGKPGDRLWVRETWRLGAWREDGRMAIDYRATPEITNTPWVILQNDPDGEKFNRYWMQASDELEEKGIQPGVDDFYHWEPGQAPLRWHSGRFMQRSFARLILEITEIGVQRVQAISGYDACAEGIVAPDAGGPVSHYRDVWDRINAKRGYPWDLNPWVWVIKFKLVNQNKDAL